eukprot:6212037-Pleurochrysis_carterae.AAC.4
MHAHSLVRGTALIPLHTLLIWMCASFMTRFMRVNEHLAQCVMGLPAAPCTCAPVSNSVRAQVPALFYICAEVVVFWGWEHSALGVGESDGKRTDWFRGGLQENKVKVESRGKRGRQGGGEEEKEEEREITSK